MSQLTGLQDQFGRRFEYLRLSVTDRCNMRCEYCLPNGYDGSQRKHYLSVEEITQLVRGFSGLGTRKVRITGGEPSLRRDLTEVITRIKHVSGITHCALTTNGLQLQKRAHLWRQAGLDSVNISIDSFDPRLFEQITGSARLEQILAGVYAAHEVGLKVKLNAVLMRQYHSEALQNSLSVVRQMPVTLRFIELMETGNNTHFFEQQHISAQGFEQQIIEQGWQLLSGDSLSGPAREYHHPEFAGKLGFITPYAPTFCDSCNRLRVSSVGRLHLCLFAEQGFDIRPWLDGRTNELQQKLQQLVGQKAKQHWLHQGNTGATTELAMLGG